VSPPTNTTASSSRVGTVTVAGVNAKTTIAMQRTIEFPTNTRQGSDSRQLRVARAGLVCSPRLGRSTAETCVVVILAPSA